jgi:hypothetical protein
MKARRGLSLLVLFLAFCVAHLGAQADPLKIEEGDVYVEAHADGFHLFIRKKPGLESVMLTESFELPNRSIDSYSLKGFSRNDINGSERRLLNGNFLDNSRQFFLISSTPQPNKRFGEAYHILIPTRIEYGYKDSTNRYGVHNLLQYKEEGKPYWFSIRSFSKAHQDYTGRYLDNAYELFLFEQEQMPQDEFQTNEEGFFIGLEDVFSRFSTTTLSKGGKVLPDDLSDLLDDVVKDMPKGNLDIAIVLDTTASMKTHLPMIKQFFLRVIEDSARDFTSVRVGFVFFKDYMEEYLTKSLEFQTNFAVVNSQIQSVTTGGGGDIPEAVYEGLYAALTQLSWQSENRLIILLGDAPPHEIPRGDVTEEMVLSTAREKGVNIYSIMLPAEVK